MVNLMYITSAVSNGDGQIRYASQDRNRISVVMAEHPEMTLRLTSVDEVLEKVNMADAFDQVKILGQWPKVS
jgi:hypothetical protein